MRSGADADFQDVSGVSGTRVGDQGGVLSEQLLSRLLVVALAYLRRHASGAESDGSGTRNKPRVVCGLIRCIEGKGRRGRGEHGGRVGSIRWGTPTGRSGCNTYGPIRV